MWQRLKDRIHKEWTQHNQDLFGYVEILAGCLEFVDANTANMVGGFFGEHYGPIISKVIQIGAGARIAYVGYQHRQGRA